MNTQTTSRLLSRAEAAAYLGLSIPTLEAWAHKGRPALNYIRVGRLAKYDIADLEAFLRANRESSATAHAAQLANA